jgi:NTE family protein
MRVGLILGGGGEVGIAWEIGVLAALEKDAAFKANTSEVVAGTSAGAIVGAYVAQGRSMLELAELDRHGKGIPVGAGFGGKVAVNPTIPQDIIAALMSAEGTLEERGTRLGKLALQASVQLDEATFVDGFRKMVGTDEWPRVDFRPTAVNTETGKTTLWDARSGLGLATAVASSCSVPGIFPPVGFGGHHYIDVPRQPFAADLISSKSLDAVIFVGLILPILANNNDQKTELEKAAGAQVRTVTITGGPGVEAVSANLLDHSARARAVEVGIEDGQRAVAAVQALLRT